MEGLFNPITILLHIVNAVILFLALRHFLYKPIRKFTAARAETIDAQLQHARDVEEDAHQKLLDSEQKLKDADLQVQSVISQSAQRAHEQAQQILAGARKETENMISQAKQDVETMMVSAHQTMADEVASLAVDIASKMLAREVKLEDHQQLVDEFVKKVG